MRAHFHLLRLSALCQRSGGIGDDEDDDDDGDDDDGDDDDGDDDQGDHVMQVRLSDVRLANDLWEIVAKRLRQKDSRLLR